MVLWVTNRKVYGAHKLWKAARRAGHDVGRDQVARLMRQMAIEGVSRQRRKVFTTRPDPDARAGAGSRQPPTSQPTSPTRCGSPISPMSRPGSGMALRVLHRRRVLPPDRRVASRGEHAHRDGPRRVGDGPAGHAAAVASSAWSPTPTPGRNSRPCGSPNGSTKSAPAHRSAPSPTVRQRARGDDERALQDRVRLRARHPRAGTTSTSSSSPPCPGCTGSTSTASTATARRPTRRVRSSVLRCPTARPAGVGNQ